MKTFSFLLLAVVAASAADKRTPDVVVYFHHGADDARIVGSAQAEAQKILASAGITVAWRLGTPHFEGSAEVIEASAVEKSDPNDRPGALGSTLLGVKTGTKIRIFYDRLLAVAPKDMLPFILGHVLAHEITHALEGVERHSDSGVMKARWGGADYRRMAMGPLPFAGEDLEMLQAWAAHHRDVLMASK